MNDDRLVELFFEIHRGLPRQGPGSGESTLRALSFCAALPEDSIVLDIGCGPGMQTMALADARPGQIIAVDTCEEYLGQLRGRVRQANLTDRVEVRNADMRQLDFAENAFDLIWCEGAAYIIGIATALCAWRPLLRDEGYLAFTELVWLEAQPADTVFEFFRAEYPAMADIESVKEQIHQAGYELVGDFTLPDSAWWDDYYTPLADKLPALRKKYANDTDALNVIALTETEIDMRRRFSSAYGYQFFVAQRGSDPGS